MDSTARTAYIADIELQIESFTVRIDRLSGFAEVAILDDDMVRKEKVDNQQTILEGKRATLDADLLLFITNNPV